MIFILNKMMQEYIRISTSRLTHSN